MNPDKCGYYGGINLWYDRSELDPVVSITFVRGYDSDLVGVTTRLYGEEIQSQDFAVDYGELESLYLTVISPYIYVSYNYGWDQSVLQDAIFTAQILSSLQYNIPQWASAVGSVSDITLLPFDTVIVVTKESKVINLDLAITSLVSGSLDGWSSSNVRRGGSESSRLPMSIRG
jgi:hypothetical protein